MEAAIKAFLKQVQRTPLGFRKVFLDVKQAFKIRNKKPLTRREYECVRNSYAAVKKIGTFFVLQAPPIIGLIPTFIYLRYPRQLLTLHFWSGSQRAQFCVDDLEERERFRQQLLTCGIPLMSPTLPPSVGMRSAIAYDRKDLELLTVTDHHWRVLAGSLGLYSLSALTSLLPVATIKTDLFSRARYIERVDELLIEEGFDEMTLEELRDTCLMRGLGFPGNSPEYLRQITAPMDESNETIKSNDHEMQQYKSWLSAWLAFDHRPQPCHLSAVASHDVLRQRDYFYLLHTAALPKLYLPNIS